MTFLVWVAIGHAENSISAEKILIDNDRVCAFQSVQLESGGFKVKARLSCYDILSGEIVLYDAQILKTYEIYFSEGVLTESGHYWLHNASIDYPISATAKTIVGFSGRDVANDVTIDLCPCSNWNIEAASMVLDEDLFILTKPSLHINDHFYPIPIRRVSADKVFAFPQLRWEDGPWVRQGFQSNRSDGVGWVEYRSRLGPSATYTQPIVTREFEASTQVHLAYSTIQETLRGAIRFDEKDDVGWFNSAVQSQHVTDEAYINDYGSSYIERQLPLAEHRFWGQVGPARLELQQLSQGPEPLASPKLVIEDASGIGPVMGYARLENSVTDFNPKGYFHLASGKDTRFVYGTAEAEVVISQSSQYWVPVLRLGTTAYADIQSTRILGRYGVLTKGNRFYLQTQQNLMRYGQGLGLLNVIVPFDRELSDASANFILNGRYPMFGGLTEDRMWIGLYHPILQPSFYWWAGSLAFVGQANVSILADKIQLLPALTYFPLDGTLQSVTLTTLLRQQKQCIQERIGISWTPDRERPVFTFQVDFKR